MADSSKHSGKKTFYPTNSIPTAQELVGLIEWFIQGEIELKFAYFLDSADNDRQRLAEHNLDILRQELINKISEVAQHKGHEEAEG